MITGYTECLKESTSCPRAKEKEEALETGSNFSICVTLNKLPKLSQPCFLIYNMGLLILT